MSSKRTLQLIHFASTAWFSLCIACILVLTLRQANVSWWLIFSLAGHSILVVLLLISLYLFAVFRGVTCSREAIEHPLTSTDTYMMFYNLCPFLGALAGFLSVIGESRVSQFITIVAMGTLLSTFLVWVIIDPLAGMIEVLFPVSRAHRIERLAKAKALRQEQKEARESLLADLLAKEEINQRRRKELLLPKVEKLTDLLVSRKIDFQAECEAIEIGVSAWIMGGVSCMQELHDMANEKCKQRNQSGDTVDYITVWWDGIGSWRNKSLV